MFYVRSAHFDFHATLEAADFEAALACARKRGFVARITDMRDGALVATWCPLYGTRVYDQNRVERSPRQEGGSR